MTVQELQARLSQIEWRDIEFKKAQRGVPNDVYPTVSAFANTSGGHIVFGIAQADGNFEIVGVLEPDKVQNEFLSALRGGSKVSCSVSGTWRSLRRGASGLMSCLSLRLWALT